MIHIEETLDPEQCYEDARTRICRLYNCKPESMVITAFNFIPPAAVLPQVPEPKPDRAVELAKAVMEHERHQSTIVVKSCSGQEIRESKDALYEAYRKMNRIASEILANQPKEKP
jgi:hypothetical protein